MTPVPDAARPAAARPAAARPAAAHPAAAGPQVGRPPTRRQLLGLIVLGWLPAGAACGTRTRDSASSVPVASVSVGPPRATATSTPARSSPYASPPAKSRQPPAAGGPARFRPGRVRWGAYLDLDGMSLAQSLALRRRQLGHDEQIVHRFFEWTDPLPDSEPDLPDGSTLMISWRGTTYARINDGSNDALIAAAGRQLARHDRPVLLRWAWEMNGDWFEWGGADNDRDTAGYRAAWRRVHRIVGEHADNVSWVWSPNWNSGPDKPWNGMGHYYPGDKYVDWVGVSGYNVAGESPQYLFGEFYDDFQARKPIMISEVGAVDKGGRTKGEWVVRFADWVNDHPRVGAVVWFDTDTHPGYDERWRIDTDAYALAAFRAMVRGPRFSG